LPWQHAQQFLRFATQGFPSRWLLIFGFLALVAAVVPMVSAFSYAVDNRDRRPPWQTAVLLMMAALGPLLALLFTAGPMLLLVHPVFVPRVMVGIGALLSGALIVMHAAARQWSATVRWQSANATIWALGMVVCACIYGNALSAQQRYEDRIASSLADDMASIREGSQESYYLLDGAAGFAVETSRVVTQFPLMGGLVSRYIGEAAVNEKFFLSYYGVGSKDLRSAPDADSRIPHLLAGICASPPLLRRSAYALRKMDDVIVVSFHDGRGGACAASAVPDAARISD
jgi:hypothetical protein